MHNIKRLFFLQLFVNCLILVYLIANSGFDKTTQGLQSEKQELPVKNINPYKADIPADYFEDNFTYQDNNTRYLADVEVSSLPVAIEEPDLSENTLKPFEEFESKMPGHPARYLDDIDPDVDGDGVSEKVYLVPVAMNHGAAYIQIVKNNQVIFESKDAAGRYFESSDSGNGFYLIESITGEPGQWNIGTKRTRYIFEEDKFAPVWYQETRNVEVEI